MLAGSKTTQSSKQVTHPPERSVISFHCKTFSYVHVTVDFFFCICWLHSTYQPKSEMWNHHLGEGLCCISPAWCSISMLVLLNQLLQQFSCCRSNIRVDLCHVQISENNDAVLLLPAWNFLSWDCNQHFFPPHPVGIGTFHQDLQKESLTTSWFKSVMIERATIYFYDNNVAMWFLMYLISRKYFTFFM